MAPSIVVLLPALVFCATVASAQITAPTPQDSGTHREPAVEQFMTAVNEYLEWHRPLETPLARLAHGADPEQAARARHAHRALILRCASGARDVLELRCGIGNTAARQPGRTT